MDGSMNDEQISLPWKLQPQPKFIRDNVLSFLATYMILFGVPITISVITDSGDDSKYFGALLLGTLPLIGIFLVTMTQELCYLWSVTFTVDKIFVQRLNGKREVWYAQDIEEIKYEPGKVLGGTHRSAWGHNPVIVYFSGGRRLSIGGSLAIAFGYSPKRISKILNRLYLSQERVD